MNTPLLQDVEQRLRVTFAERKDHCNRIGVNTIPAREGMFFFWYDYAAGTHGRLCWCPEHRLVEVTQKVLSVMAELRAAEEINAKRHIPKRLRVRRERGNLQTSFHTPQTFRVKVGSTLGRVA